MPEKNLLKIFAEKLGFKPLIKDTEACIDYQFREGCNTRCKGYDNCSRYLGLSAFFNAFPVETVEEFRQSVKALETIKILSGYTKKTPQEIENAAKEAVIEYQNPNQKPSLGVDK